MSLRDHGEEVTRAFGFGDPAQCEAFLNNEGRYGWVLVSVSEGPPWRRNSWFSLFRPHAATQDGLTETGEPLRRWMYRVIGKRRDLVDRGEEQRIQGLVDAGWTVKAVLKAPPWNERPVTFLMKQDVDVIEVVREGEDVAPKREMALARIRPEGGYDIEVIDVDEYEASRSGASSTEEDDEADE